MNAKFVVSLILVVGIVFSRLDVLCRRNFALPSMMFFAVFVGAVALQPMRSYKPRCNEVSMVATSPSRSWAQVLEKHGATTLTPSFSERDLFKATRIKRSITSKGVLAGRSSFALNIPVVQHKPPFAPCCQTVTEWCHERSLIIAAQNNNNNLPFD